MVSFATARLELDDATIERILQRMRQIGAMIDLNAPRRSVESSSRSDASRVHSGIRTRAAELVPVRGRHRRQRLPAWTEQSLVSGGEMPKSRARKPT